MGLYFTGLIAYGVVAEISEANYAVLANFHNKYFNGGVFLNVEAVEQKYDYAWDEYLRYELPGNVFPGLHVAALSYEESSFNRIVIYLTGSRVDLEKDNLAPTILGEPALAHEGYETLVALSKLLQSEPDWFVYTKYE